jgi:hypothetical protein
MFATSRSTRSLLLLGLFSLSACDNEPQPKPGQPPPVTATPRATFKGQLTLTPGTPSMSPVHLALAWYPSLFSEQAGPLSNPRAIFTENVGYSNGFPAAYTFNVTSPPPAEALVQLGDGLEGKGAVGILLAYRDRNGNGTLDTIPEDGAAVDFVVGASLAWTQPPAFMVMYLDSAQAPSTGLKQGFNLVRLTDNLTSEVVPLTTPIPMALSDDRMLDAFVCEAAWDNDTEQLPCGLTGEAPSESALALAGELVVRETHVDLSLEVRRDDTLLTDAQVSVGGALAAYDAAQGRYTLHVEDGSALLETGLVRVTVRHGDEESVRTVVVPEDFRVTMPTAPMSYSPGSEMHVAWTLEDAVSRYEVAVLAGEQVLASGTSETSWLKLQPELYEGAAVLRVEAVAGTVENEHIVVRRVREVPLDFSACDTVTPGSGLTVDGEFARYPKDIFGWESSEVRAEVKEDGVHVTDAKVTLSGWDVPYVLEVGAFHNGIISMGEQGLGDTLELRVMRQGEVLCRTLQVPGAFDLTVEGQLRRPTGSPLAVRWTKSEGAVRYDLRLGTSRYSPLYSASTNELEYTFEKVDHVGELGLRFAAVAAPAHNDALGTFDVMRVMPAGAIFTAE